MVPDIISGGGIQHNPIAASPGQPRLILCVGDKDYREDDVPYVVPAQAGTQRTFRQISKEVGDATFLDSGFRRNDELAPVAPILPLC